MAEYPSIVLTNSGLEMIAESQDGQNLIFTKLKIGDGALGTGESISTLTGVKSPKLDIPIQGFTNQGNGQVRLRYLVDNTGVAVNQGFFAREVGVYAKIGESGLERLYAYTNGGNKVDWIPDKNTPLDAQIFDVFVSIGNASNVTVNINGSATYATKLDLSEHDDDENAHGAIIEYHNADAAAHPSLLQTVTGLISEANKKIGGIGRNMLIKGQYDGSGKPVPLYSAKTNGNIKLQAGTLLTFAAGMSDDGAVDHKALLTADVTKTLAAADANTIPLSYTADLCIGGTPISGGDNTTYVKANAFADDGSTTLWKSVQTGSGANGVAYIGYDFGTAKTIRKIMLNQGTTDYVTSLLVQYSADGSSWNTALNVTGLVAGTFTPIAITVPGVASARYWRLLANSAVATSTPWTVYEIEMMEALQTHYLLADRAADGTVSLVSTKEKPKLVKPGTTTVIDGYYTADVCTGGTPISGGDYVANSAVNAFDNNPSVQWQSSQTAANQNMSALIGYNLGAGNAKKVRRIILNQSTSSNNAIPSVLVRYSDNGTAWTTTATITGLSTGVNAIDVPDVGSHQYWHLLATANVPNGYTWAVLEIEMLEYVAPQTITSTDDTMYTENRCVGGAAISSGDNITTYAAQGGGAKERAFDSDLSLWWASNTSNATMINTAYIGYDFGVPRHIRKIRVLQGAAYANFKVQNSSDGSAWADVLAVSGQPSQWQELVLPASAAKRFWRILATSARLDGFDGGWPVAEITMHELSADINLYDPIKGLSRHFDGNAWADVERVCVGKAIVNSAGVITDYTCEPYNLARLEIRDAELLTEPLTLGQFQQFGNCVAWVNFNGTGVVSIRAGMNVSSVTDNGVADYTVNFTKPMIDNNYAHVATLSDSGGTPYAPGIARANVLPSSIRISQITSLNGPGTNLDWADCNVVIFR